MCFSYIVSLSQANFYDSSLIGGSFLLFCSRSSLIFSLHGIHCAIPNHAYNKLLSISILFSNDVCFVHSATTNMLINIVLREFID